MDTIRRHAFLLALAALPLLAACGNKGPLVMPQKPVPVEQPAPGAPPASAPVEGDEPAPAATPATPADPPPAQEDGGDAGDVDG